jgi:hypothetical protein
LRIQLHILSPHKDYAISCVRKIEKLVLVPRYKLKIGCFRCSREHHIVTVRFNKNAMRSGEYLVSPLVKAL